MGCLLPYVLFLHYNVSVDITPAQPRILTLPHLALRKYLFVLSCEGSSSLALSYLFISTVFTKMICGMAKGKGFYPESESSARLTREAVVRFCVRRM